MPSEGSVNIIKALGFKFKQCFVPFPMLLVEGSSETRLFRHLSNPFFRVRKFKNTSAQRIIFFLKMSKNEYRFRKCTKKNRIVFRFSDNCIWTCCNGLPLLRRENLSSAVNGLISSSKISYITQRDFSNLNCPNRDQ